MKSAGSATRSKSRERRLVVVAALSTIAHIFKDSL
jgi:hypothetical protein